MSHIRHWVLVFFVPVIAGCTLEISQPLSDPLTAEPDESLYGHWIATENWKGKTREIHAFIAKHSTKDNPESIMEVAMVSWEVQEKKVLSGSPAYFTVTRIGKTAFMNLIDIKGMSSFSLAESGSYEKWAKNEKRRSKIVRYSCDGKKLQVWMSAEATVTKLGEAGELKIEQNVVTADSLVRHIRKKGGEELFGTLVATFHKTP